MTTPTQTEVQREWLTYAEAQTLSGLGRTTLWKLLSSGEIKAARVGRAVRINRESLEDYMERQATQLKFPGFDDATP
jgi:excisionase family DNA binding protein